MGITSVLAKLYLRDDIGVQYELDKQEFGFRSIKMVKF